MASRTYVVTYTAGSTNTTHGKKDVISGFTVDGTAFSALSATQIKDAYTTLKAMLNLLIFNKLGSVAGVDADCSNH